MAVLATLCVLDSRKDCGLCHFDRYRETTKTVARDNVKTAARVITAETAPSEGFHDFYYCFY